MSEFDLHLRPTPYLDYHHPAVAALVREVQSGGGSQVEQAVRMFVRVRDDIRYDPYRISLEPKAFTASATLEGKRGFCVTKAILYAATLRGLGVKARLGFADVKNHLATEHLLELMKTDVFAYHGYVEAWLNGRWVKATPAFNASLCARFDTAPLAFDGVNDAMLQPLNRSGARFMDYVKQRGTFDDFDFDDMVRAWSELYPHFFEGLADLKGGDFEAEADAQRGVK